MKTFKLLLPLLLMSTAMPAFSQVSNDNEDGVNKVDERIRGNDFVPGQVLVRFKDESQIEVRHNAKGKFRAASISAVDRLLREYGVDKMEKLFPSEVAKPKSKLRSRRAPNGSMIQERNLDKVFWVKTTIQSPDSTLDLIEQLQTIPEVEYAEPNYRVYITADVPTDGIGVNPNSQKNIHLAPVRTETDASMICANPSQNPLYAQQYGINLHKIQTLWDKPIINKKRPVIAILDTGVDITHPDLKDNIWQNTKEVEGELAYDDDGNGIVDDEYGWNFADNYYDITDRNGHGTHVAGIAAACDNGVGVVGANPQAFIMPVKVIGDRGTGNIADMCRGILYAAAMGADIINMSLGHTGEISLTETDAIQKAYVTAILVASAGNYGDTVYGKYGPLWPAAYYLVLGVQCCGKDGKRAAFSNYDPDGPIFSEDGIDGRNHEMMLAGVDIYSTLPNGKYDKLSGTSMSAPLLSGAISALQMVKDYPSKDFLFGDLIHLEADFEKIFSDDTPRTPKIDLVALNYDDSKEGNGDGQVDAGETVDFSVVLRNTWADATNIQFKVSVVDEKYKDFVQIVNPEVDFGYSLSAYARQTCKTPVKIKFANSIGQNTRIKFCFEIQCDESNDTIKIDDVYVTVYNMVKLEGMISSDMTLMADKNYLVNDMVYIVNDATLTIEPGTHIKVAHKAGFSARGNSIIKADGTPESPIYIENFEGRGNNGYLDGNNSISYVYFRNIGVNNFEKLENCVLYDWAGTVDVDKIEKCVYKDTHISFPINAKYNNFVNNYEVTPWSGRCFSYSWIGENNYFNNYSEPYYNSQSPEKYWGKIYAFAAGELNNETYVIHVDNPPYVGTGREEVIRPYIWEFGNAPNTMVTLDLSNMRTSPFTEAHGIVWKVVVNGFDAQDESENLPPLGVGKHKFEVYFNRPMNKAVAPKIAFGVREPYNQHAINEDGSWNEEGTIYTAYYTISGKTMSDGLNLIYIQGAEDNEFFEIPYEKTRFKFFIQAAGSMATGFAAEAGLGRVNLTWNNENNDFEDAMGFNIYRYTINENGQADTICINKEIVGIETTAYTDYDVTPGTTYYYLYRVLSTDLKEFDVSNVVAATPLTSTLGDANGSGEVDVADVITTVNKIVGMEPKPFIFEAADMNVDLTIDVLDIIGIIQKIVNPEAGARIMAEAEAVYTIEDGTLYVESPVALAGVQVQIALSEECRVKSEEFATAEDLDGFEHTSAWLSENDYLFLAYNLNGKTLSAGKHALLYLGDAKISDIRLSDADGHNVKAVGDETTRVNRIVEAMTVKGIYDLQGRKLSGDSKLENALPKGVYIINGKKVVK